MLVAIGIAAIWFGGSSVSERVRTTILEWITAAQDAPDEARATDQSKFVTEAPISLPPDELSAPAPRPAEPSTPESLVERPPSSPGDSLDPIEDARRSAGSEGIADANPSGESAPGSIAPSRDNQRVAQPSDRSGDTARPFVPQDLPQDGVPNEREAKAPNAAPRGQPETRPQPVPALDPLRAQQADARLESDEPAAVPPAATDDDPFAALERRLKPLSFEIERTGNLLTADLGRSVWFADGSAELNRAARQTLRQVADALKETDDIGIKIVGHTDSSGTEARNQMLSGQRASVVAQYLTDQGVPGERLVHEGRGHAEPKLDADQERIQGPWVNRRIELELSRAPRDSE
jgi:outer membrane protein OmpA-like peptidoglycan-associated protein